MMPAKIPEPAKVMDVTHPKNVQPSATSRPVLVVSRPMIVTDPMIAQPAVDVLTKGGAEKSAGDPSELPARTPELIVDREAKTITPDDPTVSAESPSASEPVSAVESQVIDADTVPAGVPPVDSAAAKALPTPSIVITEPAETTRAVEAARVGASTSQPLAAVASTPSERIHQAYEVTETDTEDTSDDDSNAEITPEQKQTENIEKLIASRLYAVPIGKRAKRRSRIVLLIVFTLLLALISLDLLLDMDILSISGVPHTTFFSL